MISYKKQRYDEIRTPITDDVFVKLVQETLAVNGVEIEENIARRVLVSLLASISFYFFNYPTFYMDFKKMVLYRDTKLSNLLVLESKEEESAKTIMEYYKQGGALSEELENMILSFTQGLLSYSTEKQAKVSEEISKIKEAQRKSK